METTVNFEKASIMTVVEVAVFLVKEYFILQRS